MNARADLFNEHLKQNMPDTFRMEEVKDDDRDTVIFFSNFSAKDETIPFAVFFDDSIFPVVRVFLAHEAVNDDNRDEIRDFFNEMNGSFKMFKYYDDADGNVFMDVCLPATDEHFDITLIHAIIDMIINHFTNDFEDFAKDFPWRS